MLLPRMTNCPGRRPHWDGPGLDVVILGLDLRLAHPATRPGRSITSKPSLRITTFVASSASTIKVEAAITGSPPGVRACRLGG